MSRRDPYEFKPVDGAKVFWKSLEDKANPAAAQKRAESEFPLGLQEAKALKESKDLVKLRRSKASDSEMDVSVGRRGFMFFAGASAALFAEGCARRPVEKLSKTRTSHPASSRASTRWDPMKPPPPVTKAFIDTSFPLDRPPRPAARDHIAGVATCAMVPACRRPRRR